MIREGYPKLAFIKLEGLTLNEGKRFRVPIPKTGRPGHRDWFEQFIEDEEPVFLVNQHEYTKSTLLNVDYIKEMREKNPYIYVKREYSYIPSLLYYYIPVKTIVKKLVTKNCLNKWLVGYKNLPSLDQCHFTTPETWYKENAN